MALSIGIFAGFAIASYFSGKQTGVKGKISTRVKVKNYVIHLHHWLCAIVLLFAAHEFFQTHPWSYEVAFYGFLLGVIVQGLTYSDFHKLIYRFEEDDSESLGAYSSSSNQ